MALTSWPSQLVPTSGIPATSGHSVCHAKELGECLVGLPGLEPGTSSLSALANRGWRCCHSMIYGGCRAFCWSGVCARCCQFCCQNLPGIDMASAEHGVYEVAQGCLFPWTWAKPDGQRSDGLEGVDQPGKWALRVLEAIDEDRSASLEATFCEFPAIGDGAVVVSVGRQDLLDRPSNPRVHSQGATSCRNGKSGRSVLG